MKKKSNSELLKYSLVLLLLFIASMIYAQQDYYWVGGSGNWSDYTNHWATTSGGTEFHTGYPETGDNVYFDENSFTAEGQMVTADVYPECRDMNWTGAMFMPMLNISDANGDNSSQQLYITGSLTFIESMNISGKELYLDPVDIPITIRTNGLSLDNFDLIVVLSNHGAEVELMDSLSVKSLETQNANAADFSTNGNPIHAIESIDFSAAINDGIFDFSGSHFYTKSFLLTGINTGSAHNPTLAIDGMNISIIYSGGKTVIDKEGVGSIEKYSVEEDHKIDGKIGFSPITYSPPIFDHLFLEEDVELEISPEINGLVFTNITAEGSHDNRIAIRSSVADQTAYLSKSEDVADFRFVDFKDIEATGGASFNAFISEDLGNVTGINFIKLDQQIVFDLPNKNFEDINKTFALNDRTDVELPISYQIEDEAIVEVINGNELLIKSLGTTRITASQVGNEFYNYAEVVRIFEVTKTDQIITFPEISDTWIGEVFINLNTEISSDLAIEYQISGPANLDGNVLEFTGKGTVQVTASQVGNENYNAAESVSRSFQVIKRDQTIEFSEIGDKWVGNSFVNIEALVDSDLPLTYNVTGPATLNGQTVEFTGVGTVQVTASQAGNDNYNAADPVIHSFEVFKQAQTITFSEIADTSEDVGFLNLDATSDSDLPVTYSVVGPVEVVDGVLEFTGSGMVQVTAMQLGDDLYLAAEEVRRSFKIESSVTEKPLSFTQTEISAKVYPNPVVEYLNFNPQLNIESVIVNDLNGRIFYQGQLKNNQLDMSDYESGIYLLTISQAGGEEVIQRIKVN